MTLVTVEYPQYIRIKLMLMQFLNIIQFIKKIQTFHKCSTLFMIYILYKNNKLAIKKQKCYSKHIFLVMA